MAAWTEPPDWHDDERMNFLSAPLPEKRTDKPGQWDTQTKFWSDLIVSSCTECTQLSVRGEELEERFTRSGRKPACLDGVVKEACSQSVLRMFSLWENDCRSSWLQWGAGLASSWISSSLATDSTWLDVHYVIPSLVKRFSSEVLAEHGRCVRAQGRNDLLDCDAFAALCRRVYPALSDRDVLLLKNWLRKSSKLAAQQDDRGIEVIKLPATPQQCLSALSKQDVALFKLRECCTMLAGQIEQLLSDVKRCTERAKEKQMLGLRDVALSWLRRRKRLQAAVLKKEGACDNIEQLIHGLQAADDDKKVVDAIQLGTRAYREALADIDVDKIADTMDELSDLHDKHSEISTVMSAAGGDGASGEFDMTELEAELESLIQQDSTLDGHGSTVGLSAAHHPTPTSSSEVCIPVEPPATARVQRITSKSPSATAKKPVHGHTSTADHI